MTFPSYGPQCDQRWVENVCQCGTHRTPLRKGDGGCLCDVKPWCRFRPFRCRLPGPWCRFQALGIPPLPLDASLPAFPGSPYRTLGLLVPLIFSLDSLQPQSPPFHLLLPYSSTPLPRVMPTLYLHLYLLLPRYLHNIFLKPFPLTITAPDFICTFSSSSSSFRWRMGNETLTQDVTSEGLESRLRLPATSDSLATYSCFVNNTIGESIACEIDVTGEWIKILIGISACNGGVNGKRWKETEWSVFRG